MPISMNISLTELEKLRNKILAESLKRVEPKSDYELLRIEDGEVNIIVYKSGKLVHNDSEASRRIIDSILERERKYDFLLGSDEVGKGEWYGPLVVVCAALSPADIVHLRKIGVRDSKLLGKAELGKLASEIFRSKILYRDVTLMPEIYNQKYTEFHHERKTLNDLLAWCHVAAIKSTLAYVHSARTKIVIDKFDFKKTDLRLERADIENENMEIIQSSKGDTEIPVSVASIIAKNRFEKIVDEMNQKLNLDLRTLEPTELDPDILPHVAKLHFKNVQGMKETTY
jgi:ribonuclease HIII